MSPALCCALSRFFSCSIRAPLPSSTFSLVLSTAYPLLPHAFPLDVCWATFCHWFQCNVLPLARPSPTPWITGTRTSCHQSVHFQLILIIRGTVCIKYLWMPGQCCTVAERGPRNQEVEVQFPCPFYRLDPIPSEGCGQEAVNRCFSLPLLPFLLSQ